MQDVLFMQYSEVLLTKREELSAMMSYVSNLIGSRMVTKASFGIKLYNSSEIFKKNMDNALALYVSDK